MTPIEDGKIDFKALQAELEGEVHSDPLRCYLIATDGSIYKKEPVGVIYPKNTGDVEKTVRFAKQHKLSIHPRGSGSGLCGSAIGGGLVIDFSKYMNQLLSLDLEKRCFECQPGYRLGELEVALKNSGLFFPPDPSSGEYASFGGMYGTNASGAHSVKYGNVADYIIDAEIVLADGFTVALSQIEGTPKDKLPEGLQKVFELYQNNKESIEKAYPEIRCNVAGYNLRSLIQNESLTLHKLFGGAEGTLGVVTKLKFRLIEKPTYESLVVAFFDDIINSAKAVQRIMPMNPAGIEIMDKSLLELAKENEPELRDKIPDGVDNVLLIEFDAFKEEEARKEAETAKQMIVKEKLTQNAHLAASAEEKARFWGVRKAAVPILYKLKSEKKILALIEDAAIPTHNLVHYFEGIYKILNKRNLRFVVYGHIAKGLMHTRPLLNLKDETDVALLKELADEVYELVTGLEGTVSGEHGDGRIRSAYVKRFYPQIYPYFEEIKRLLDPEGLLNPEIILNTDPNLISSNLRFGSQYQETDLEQKQLQWEEGFINQVEMCHGCSKCTTITTATRMCPIFKFTRDESASPKAKANVLRGLISGAIPEPSLFEQGLQSVINKCVNCGSCHQECPSNVNIPKLALEAKAQYTKKFGPTLYDRAVSNVEATARASKYLGPFANPLMGASLSKKMAELLLGVSSKREAVRFSSTPLRKRIKEVEGSGSKKVLYFAGCYASFIRPEIGEAAIKTMNAAGFSVVTPEQHCCGLPFLSKGMSEQAKVKVQQNLDEWQNRLETVDHIVVTCSSCGLSLLQEWAYLIGSEKATPIKEKVIHISALLAGSVSHFNLDEKPLAVGYHMPCHLKIQEESQSTLKLMEQIPGVDVKHLDSHCCGIAGSWGLAKKNYDLSKEIAEDMIEKLDQSKSSIGATDCPTCRMQMEEFSSKTIKHPIEILAERLR